MGPIHVESGDEHTPARAYGAVEPPGGRAGILGLLANVAGKNELDKDGPPEMAAVVGIDDYSSNGVAGRSVGGNGVSAISDSGNGIYAASKTGKAGYFDGAVQVKGNSQLDGNAQVGGTFQVGGSADIKGDVKHRGNLEVSGNVNVLHGDVILVGADCAEDFAIGQSEAAEPGTVMVIGENTNLEVSSRPYDRRVAGVVAGAGDLRPGVRLDRQCSTEARAPISLIGKTYCKVDAAYGAIEVGDLLTTSATPGHAMRAHDPASAFGAVIGKALRPHTHGLGLIPILIALQ